MNELKNKIKTHLTRPLLKALGILVLVLAAVYILTPKPQLYETYNFSSAVYDKKGKLLKISLSQDDKYRLFTPIKQIPDEAIKALLLYEDRGFYYHFGVNLFSILRAALQMTGGGRKSGASTITMQVARIIFHIDSSTIVGKIKQMLRALQLEMFYSKQEILEAYFNLAPYGGNIEGIGAASLIYFNSRAQQLYLPQITTLTVIPQNPEKRSLLTASGRRNNAVAGKRLGQIWKEKYKHRENEYLDLPQASGIYLPNEAPHFVRRVLQKHQGEITTTLDLNYQHQAEEILHKYVRENNSKGIYNAVVLITDAETSEIVAYIGSDNFYDSHIQGQVDGVTALRSAGSALKPFIYALALQQGIIHPHTMLKDVPKNYGLYTPENFDRAFYGMIDATQALILSRNIPAVDLLLKIGADNFYELLQKSGVRKLRSADFYGLAMALGGVEISMQNLAELYAMLYNNGQLKPLRLTENDQTTATQLLTPEAAYITLKMLTENKPTDRSINSFSAPKNDYPVAWKTGTSYGFKDAWSVGVVGHYVVAVWIGNFDAAPNSAFVGRDIAAPLFFKLVRNLAKQTHIPHKLKAPTGLNLSTVNVCRDTGDIATDDCSQTVMTYFIPNTTTVKISNISRKIPIDVKTGLRACRHTPPTTIMKSYNFWPSDVLQAYAKAGIYLRKPPEFKENCSTVDIFNQGNPPQILLPTDGTRFLLRSHQLEHEKISLKASVDADAEKVFWFINNKLVGETPAGQILEAKPDIGVNEIKAVDNLGRMTTIKITSTLID